MAEELPFNLQGIMNVERVHLEPGDFLAVNCDFYVTTAMAEQIKDGFKRFETRVGREIPILILEKGMRLIVVGPSPEGGD